MKLNHPAYRVFAVLVLTVGWVLIGFFPVKKKLGVIAGQQTEADARLSQYLKLAPQIPLWQKRKTELELSAIRLLSNLYTPAEAEKFLKDLMELAQKEGLKVLDARPTFLELLHSVREMDSTSANLVRPVSFSLKVEGGYATISGLAEKIERLPAFRGFFLAEATRGEAGGSVDATLTFYGYLIINPWPGA